MNPSVNKVLFGKYQTLGDILGEMKSVIIAMSGGVDSVLLAKTASDTLHDQALIVTVDSPLLPRRELRDVVDLAGRLGLRHLVIHIEILSHISFSSNPLDRCYICKNEIITQLEYLKEKERISWICFGENVDDSTEFRPGSRAALERGVRSPLKEANLSKAEIRILARDLDLPVWNKPASACLGSRIPYGVEITSQNLAQAERAEETLYDLGFPQSRVRHLDQAVRIEVPVDQMQKLCSSADLIVKRFKEIGFKHITLDLAGYRTGSLNEAAGLANCKEN